MFGGLERRTKQPKGPALALLNVIKRKGFDDSVAVAIRGSCMLTENDVVIAAVNYLRQPRIPYCSSNVQPKNGESILRPLQLELDGDYC